LRSERVCSFRALVADADSTLVIVARFLALLELFREHVVAFDQVSPLGELTVRWTGGDDPESVADLRIDEFEGAPEPAPEPEAYQADDDHHHDHEETP
jgi:segregation and condensation protein A